MNDSIGSRRYDDSKDKTDLDSKKKTEISTRTAFKVSFLVFAVYWEFLVTAPRWLNFTFGDKRENLGRARKLF